MDLPPYPLLAFFRISQCLKKMSKKNPYNKFKKSCKPLQGGCKPLTAKDFFHFFFQQKCLAVRIDFGAYRGCQRPNRGSEPRNHGCKLQHRALQEVLFFKINLNSPFSSQDRLVMISPTKFVSEADFFRKLILRCISVGKKYV